MLTKQEVVETFMNTLLEGDYNFLEDDLVKLANAFVAKAADKIARTERIECVKFVKSLNTLVGQALEEKRSKL